MIGIGAARIGLPVRDFRVHLSEVLRLRLLQQLPDLGVELEGCRQSEFALVRVIGKVEAPAVDFGPVVQLAHVAFTDELRGQTDFIFGSGERLRDAVDGDTLHRLRTVDADAAGGCLAWLAREAGD